MVSWAECFLANAAVAPLFIEHSATLELARNRKNVLHDFASYLALYLVTPLCYDQPDVMTKWSLVRREVCKSQAHDDNLYYIALKFALFLVTLLCYAQPSQTR